MHMAKESRKTTGLHPLKRYLWIWIVKLTKSGYLASSANSISGVRQIRRDVSHNIAPAFTIYMRATESSRRHAEYWRAVPTEYGELEVVLVS